MTVKKGTVQCPVCGRYTTAKAISAYEAKTNSRIKSLENKLHSSEDMCKNLGKWNEEKNKQIEELKQENTRLLDEIHFIKSRGLWERIINRF